MRVSKTISLVTLGMFTGFMLSLVLGFYIAPRTHVEAVPALPGVPSTVHCQTPGQRGSYRSINIGNAEAGQRHAAAAGWTGDNWNALLELWTCESSWNQYAANPSGAYGIAQFMPATWASYGCSKSSDPDVQIACGVRYIQKRYTTPRNALDFHYRNNYY